MNYCQKHTNHHCIHAHECKDPKHKKKKILQAKKSTQNFKTTKNVQNRSPMKTIVSDDQCCFLYQQTIECSPLEKEIYDKKLDLVSIKNNQLNKKALDLEIENRKVKENNKHLEAQTAYLREQLELLVSTHNIDIQEQIRKSLKDLTRLSLQNKEKVSKIGDLQREVQELESKNYSLNKKVNHLERKATTLESELKEVRSTASSISSDKSKVKQVLEKKQKELKALKDRYELLNNSLSRETRDYERQIDSLKRMNEKLQKDLRNVQKQLKQHKQLSEIQNNASQKLINELKHQLNSKAQLYTEAKDKIDLQKQIIQTLKDDYNHAKNIILKYEDNNTVYEKEKQEMLKRGQFASNASENQQKQNTKTAKNYISQFNKKEDFHLIQQNQLLKEKIRTLEQQLGKKHQVSDYEGIKSEKIVLKGQDLYLSIGASQEFKKLIEQKNATIRKLMKEKTSLYNQIYEFHAGTMPR